MFLREKLLRDPTPPQALHILPCCSWKLSLNSGSSPGLDIAFPIRYPRDSGWGLGGAVRVWRWPLCVMLRPHQINMKEGMSRERGGGWKEPVPSSGQTRVQLMVQLFLAQLELDLTEPCTLHLRMDSAALVGGGSLSPAHSGPAQQGPAP